MTRLVLINVLIGLLAAVIAQGKGYSFIRWWINGALWGPFGLLYVIFMGKNEEGMRRRSGENTINCPHCDQMIATDASKCQYCQKDIDIVDV